MVWHPERLLRNLDTWYCGFCRKGRLPVFWSRNSIGFSSDPDDRNTLRVRFGSPDLNTHTQTRETVVNNTKKRYTKCGRSALAYPTAWRSASGRGPWTVPRPPASPCRRARADPRPDVPCGTRLWPAATGCRRPRLWAWTTYRKTARASIWKRRNNTADILMSTNSDNVASPRNTRVHGRRCLPVERGHCGSPGRVVDVVA